VCCWNDSNSLAFVDIASFVLLSPCVFLCSLVGCVWVRCVVDLLFFLSGVCLIGGCGLRETHAGLLQTVSDSSTVGLFFFGCVS